MNLIRIQLKSMAKKKRKLTAREKADRAQRRREYMTVFIGGKMKRVRRPQQIDGMDPDEFIRRNADPIWLHQNEMWECLAVDDAAGATNSQPAKSTEEDAPF